MKGQDPAQKSQPPATTPDAAHGGNRARWFDAAGCGDALPEQRVFNGRPHVVDAVMSGLGAHLLDVRLTARKVAEGRLVHLGEIEVVSDMSCRTVRSADWRPHPRLDPPAYWLAAEALPSDGQPPPARISRFHE